MEFNGINGNKLESDLKRIQSCDNEKQNNSQSDSQNICDIQKMPNNPTYWQNSIGIKNKVSFKGNKSDNNVQKAESSERNTVDSNLENIVNELIERGIPSEYALSFAENAIDEKTGEVNLMAQKLIDFFFPLKTDKGVKNKFKYLKNSLKNKIITRSKVEISIDGSPLEILNSIKNKNGDFEEINFDYLFKIIKMIRDNCSYCSLSFLDIKQIIDMIKDKNGVVSPSKFKRFESMYMKNDEEEIAKVLNSLDSFPNDKQDVIFNTCIKLFENEEIGISNLPNFLNYCFDENGNGISENIDFVKKITKINENIVFPKAFFDLCKKHPEHKSFILKIIENIEYQNSIDIMVSFINSQIESEGELSDTAKDKMLVYAESGLNLENFPYIYEYCSSKEFSNMDGFNENLFSRIIKLREIIKAIDATNSYKSGQDYIGIINGNIKPNEINFKNKINLLNDLKAINAYVLQNNIEGFENIGSAITTLESSLEIEDISLPIDKKDEINFKKDVLRSSEKYTEFETVMVSSIPMLEQMNKEEGIPLLYTRNDFLADLNSLCQSDEDIDILVQKTGINPLFQDGENSNKITGYNGIIKLDELDLDNPKEKQIYNLMHKFLYENKVITKDENFNKQLNTIISACPEFINIIGKRQHGTHNYTLDVHSLLVLAYSINNPAYLSKLNSLDRSLLKVATIFHDIMKQENTVDRGHQNLSSLYSRSILFKIFDSSEILNRIFGLVDNHHWLQEYSESPNKENTAKKLAFKFRMPNDFELAKIMADADLKAVSPSFYENHKYMLTADELELIQKNINYIYSQGNAIFSDRIIKPSCLEDKVQIKDGKEYKVVNMHEISDGTDMGQYGFMKGVKKEDLFLLVHMVDDNNIYESLSTVKLLTSPFNGGVLSESLITPKYQRTYQNRKYGVLLSQENMNLVNESNKNQGSGIQKDFSKVIDFIFNDSSFGIRNNFRTELLSNLGILNDEISDEEYGRFFKDVFAYRTAFEQINPDDHYKLGNKNISGAQIRKAIFDYQKGLINIKEKTHNEIVGYLPKIQGVVAKAKNLDEVPDDLLKFANENNYPIILM